MEDWHEEAAREENEWVRAVILKPGHPAQAEALEIATNARDMAGQALGKDHPSYAEAVQNLGLYYLVLGNDEQKAVEYIEQARSLVGRYHPVLSRSFYFLGKHYYESGEPEMAEGFLSEALDILRREGYEADPRIAEVLTIAADIMAAAGNNREAAACRDEIARIEDTLATMRDAPDDL
jgi:tetratricopeptide (TPR) repeat protein